MKKVNNICIELIGYPASGKSYIASSIRSMSDKFFYPEYIFSKKSNFRKICWLMLSSLSLLFHVRYFINFILLLHLLGKNTKNDSLRKFFHVSFIKYFMLNFQFRNKNVLYSESLINLGKTIFLMGNSNLEDFDRYVNLINKTFPRVNLLIVISNDIELLVKQNLARNKDINENNLLTDILKHFDALTHLPTTYIVYEFKYNYQDVNIQSLLHYFSNIISLNTM